MMFTLICLKNKNYKLVRMFSLTKLMVEFGSHSWYYSEKRGYYVYSHCSVLHNRKCVDKGLKINKLGPTG